MLDFVIGSRQSPTVGQVFYGQRLENKVFCLPPSQSADMMGANLVGTGIVREIGTKRRDQRDGLIRMYALY